MIHSGIEAHGHYIMEECLGTFTPGLDTVLSRTVGNEFVGGVVYTAHTGRSCQMHQWGATPRWIDVDMLWAAFHYPFVQLDYDCVLGLVRASHSHTLAVNAKYGFKEAARIKAVYPGDDLVILQMFKHECRWLKLRPRSIVSG